MANQTWADDASTIFFAAEPFLRISRQQIFTVGERHCVRSGELPPTAKHLVAGRTDLSGDQQSGSSPYPCGEFLDPPMFRVPCHEPSDTGPTAAVSIQGQVMSQSVVQIKLVTLAVIPGGTIIHRRPSELLLEGWQQGNCL